MSKNYFRSVVCIILIGGFLGTTQNSIAKVDDEDDFDVKVHMLKVALPGLCTSLALNITGIVNPAVGVGGTIAAAILAVAVVVDGHGFRDRALRNFYADIQKPGVKLKDVKKRYSFTHLAMIIGSKRAEKVADLILKGKSLEDAASAIGVNLDKGPGEQELLETSVAAINFENNKKPGAPTVTLEGNSIRVHHQKTPAEAVGN